MNDETRVSGRGEADATIVSRRAPRMPDGRTAAAPETVLSAPYRPRAVPSSPPRAEPVPRPAQEPVTPAGQAGRARLIGVLTAMVAVVVVSAVLLLLLL